MYNTTTLRNVKNIANFCANWWASIIKSPSTFYKNPGVQYFSRKRQRDLNRFDLETFISHLSKTIEQDLIDFIKYHEDNNMVNWSGYNLCIERELSGLLKESASLAEIPYANFPLYTDLRVHDGEIIAQIGNTDKKTVARIDDSVIIDVLENNAISNIGYIDFKMDTV